MACCEIGRQEPRPAHLGPWAQRPIYQSPKSVENNKVRQRLLVLPVLLTLAGGFVSPVGAQPVSPEIGSGGQPVIIGQPIRSEPHIDFIDEPTESDIADALDSIQQAAAGETPSQPLPDGVQFALSGDDFILDYRTPIPEETKVVFEAVMAEWADVLDMNGAGIHINIFYQELAAGTLGGTSTYRVAVTQDGETFAITTALLNARLGSDQYPWDSDIQVYVNSTVSWNLQTSGSTPTSEYSLYTTMLHEIGHGLGFWGDIEPDTVASDILSSFDMRLYHDTAAAGGIAPAVPVRTSQHPVTGTDHSWFKNLDGTWERIYDPSGGYRHGSSMSHFDEWAYGPNLPLGGALMTPMLGGGETIYDVDNVTLGIMEASGWKIKRPPVAPQIQSASVNSSSVELVLTPDTRVLGPPASQWEVVVKQGSTTMGSALVDATQRSVSVPVFLSVGDYEITVVARGSGGSSDPVSAPIQSSNAVPDGYGNCRQAPVNPAFATSDPTKASLFRLYCSYFLRNPDSDGFEYWSQTYSSGATGLNDISNLFATSAEFQLTYGSLSNEEFIDLIYNNVMERAAEPQGFQYWLSKVRLGELTRGEVMFYFSQSAEFQAKTGTVS